MALWFGSQFHCSDVSLHWFNTVFWIVIAMLSIAYANNQECVTLKAPPRWIPMHCSWHFVLYSTNNPNQHLNNIVLYFRCNFKMLRSQLQIPFPAKNASFPFRILYSNHNRASCCSAWLPLLVKVFIPLNVFSMANCLMWHFWQGNHYAAMCLPNKNCEYTDINMICFQVQTHKGQSALTILLRYLASFWKPKFLELWLT